MVDATFRFYGDLNDFLLPAQRGQPVAWSGPAHAAVKHPIESIGIPHPEVESIYANGVPVGFDYAVQPGDVLDVLPLAYDACEVVAATAAVPVLLRPPLPRPVRFVLDTHLGVLASYLRLLGFDTLYRNDYADPELAAITAAEQRVLLTRDRGLLKRKAVVYGYWVRQTAPRQQVVAVLRRYRLGAAAQPWRRCARCNGLLVPVPKAAVLDQLEPKTRLYYNDFQRCTGCGQVFWQGSHYERLVALMAAILADLGKPG